MNKPFIYLKIKAEGLGFIIIIIIITIIGNNNNNTELKVVSNIA